MQINGGSKAALLLAVVGLVAALAHLGSLRFLGESLAQIVTLPVKEWGTDRVGEPVEVALAEAESAEDGLLLEPETGKPPRPEPEDTGTELPVEKGAQEVVTMELLPRESIADEPVVQYARDQVAPETEGPEEDSIVSGPPVGGMPPEPQDDLARQPNPDASTPLDLVPQQASDQLREQPSMATETQVDTEQNESRPTAIPTVTGDVVGEGVHLPYPLLFWSKESVDDLIGHGFGAMLVHFGSRTYRVVCEQGCSPFDSTQFRALIPEWSDRLASRGYRLTTRLSGTHSNPNGLAARCRDLEERFVLRYATRHAERPGLVIYLTREWDRYVAERQLTAARAAGVPSNGLDALDAVITEGEILCAGNRPWFLIHAVQVEGRRAETWQDPEMRLFRQALQLEN